MLDKELGDRALQMQAEDDKMLMSLAPKARKEFGVQALNRLVDSWNSLAPLFGIKDVYPTFTEATTVLPTDFTKVLLMVDRASQDAAKDKLKLDPLGLETINDDRGLVILASKLSSLAKNRDFKDWLLSAETPETNVEESTEDMGEMEMEPQAPMSDDEFTKLIGSRLVK